MKKQHLEIMLERFCGNQNFPPTLDELAKKYSLTKERIRKIIFARTRELLRPYTLNNDKPIELDCSRTHQYFDKKLGVYLSKFR